MNDRGPGEPIELTAEQIALARAWITMPIDIREQWRAAIFAAALPYRDAVVRSRRSAGRSTHLRLVIDRDRRPR